MLGGLLGELRRLVLAPLAQLVGNRADVARLARDLLAGVGRALIDLATDAIARLACHLLSLLLRLASSLLNLLLHRLLLSHTVGGRTGLLTYSHRCSFLAEFAVTVRSRTAERPDDPHTGAPNADLGNAQTAVLMIDATAGTRADMATAARSATGRTRATTSSPPKLPALLMGVGLGGLIDGILLHQILQWHHLLTGDNGGKPMSTVAGLEANTLADGLFHIASWMFVAMAMLLTVRAWQRQALAPPWRGHFGMLLAGWGAFNLVEGLVNHQVLGIHHLRDDLGAPLGWDLAFLASGAILIAIGFALTRSGEQLARQSAPRSQPRPTRA